MYKRHHFLMNSLNIFHKNKNKNVSLPNCHRISKNFPRISIASILRKKKSSVTLIIHGRIEIVSDNNIIALIATQVLLYNW